MDANVQGVSKKGYPPEEAPINRLSNGFSLYFPDSVVG